MLLIAAFFWGTTFVAQQLGMDAMGPFTYLAARSFLGAAVLCPIALLLRRRVSRSAPFRPSAQPALWVGGALCGVVLFLSSILQQIGIQYTTAGKCGFITSLYIVLVPVLSLALRLTRRVGRTVWVGVALAAVGLGLLCLDETFTLGRGDALVLVCAVCFSAHILLVARFSPRVDGVALSCLQFIVVGVLSLLAALVVEAPTFSQVLAGWKAVAWAGLFSSALAYTLQILGQKRVPPTAASLLMSLESVFAVLAGAVVLHERLSPREGVGCVLMFAAIILAQLPDRRHRAERPADPAAGR